MESADGALAWVDRKRRVLAGIVVLVYLAGCNGQWRIEPDTGLYLSLARNLASGRGYTYHGRPHGLAYPGLPYVLAGVYRLFPQWHPHAGDLVIENLLMPAAGLASLAIAYWMLKLAAGRPMAVLAAFSLGLTRTYYRASFSLLTDLPFLLGVTLFFFGHQALLRRRKTLGWGGMFAGFVVAVSMRPTWVVLAPVVLLAIMHAGWRGAIYWRTAALAGIIAVCTVAALYEIDPRRSVGAGEQTYESAIVEQAHAGSVGTYLATAAGNVRDIFLEYTPSAILGVKLGRSPDSENAWRWYDAFGNVASAMVTIAVLAACVLLVGGQAVWVVWIGATFAVMALFMPLERYYLQALPMLMLACWEGVFWVSRRLSGRGQGWLPVALAAVLVVPNVVGVGGIIAEQRRTPFMAHYRNGKFVPLFAAAEAIRQLPADAVVLAPLKTERILTYLSDRDVEEFWELPDDSRRPHYRLELPAAGGFKLERSD